MRGRTNERFEREKLCYEQNCEHFRSLNQIMWQVPVIAMTLTGGLWFGASEVDLALFRYLLLILAAIGNAGLIVVLERMRFLIQLHLDKMQEFYPPGFVAAGAGSFLRRPRVVVRTFQTLLALSSLISVLALVGLLNNRNTAIPSDFSLYYRY